MLFTMLNVLYLYISTSQRICAVPNMTVVCRYLILCLPRMVLQYFLNGFEMVPVSPIIIIIIIISSSSSSSSSSSTS